MLSSKPRKRVEQAQAGVEAADANVAKAKDGVMQAQAALDQAKAAVANAQTALTKSKASDDLAKTQEQIALNIQRENAAAISQLASSRWQRPDNNVWRRTPRLSKPNQP
jgi:hypothetical protein